MGSGFEYIFPAVRGIQAGREYFSSMCPLRLIPKIFLFDEEELIPEVRAQRALNRNRIPEIARYMTDNRDSYVFSAITASVDGDLKFQAYEKMGPESDLGVLHVPMNARFVINDGQHRRAAIEAALRECPELADETIAVVLFHDAGLKRCQQMFADLNRYAIRPSTSLGLLYDHRDMQAEISRRTVTKTPIFRELVEMERSTLALRSRRLFTFSAIHTATKALLQDFDFKDVEEASDLASAFWSEVAKQIPEWEKVRTGKLSAREVRQDLLNSHGVVLQALGKAGNALLAERDDKWRTNLRNLKKLNWSRTNTKLWNGRILINGRVSKASTNITLTSNAIKDALGLDLNPEEQKIEDAFKRGEYDH